MAKAKFSNKLTTFTAEQVADRIQSIFAHRSVESVRFVTVDGSGDNVLLTISGSYVVVELIEDSRILYACPRVRVEQLASEGQDISVAEYMLDLFDEGLKLDTDFGEWRAVAVTTVEMTYI